HAGNAAALEDYLVSEGVPALVDIHGPSGSLRDYPRLMAQLQQLEPMLFIVRGLSAREDPRCPGGKDATLALSAAQLLATLEREAREGEAETALRRWRCAWAYQPLDALPNAADRERLARSLDEQARRAESEGNLLQALRRSSLATLLTQGNAHRRRYTESLRS